MSSDAVKLPSRFHRYQLIGQELARRTREPIVHPTFVIYFLVGVVGLGSLGLWFELSAFLNAPSADRSLDGIRIALTTLFPTLAGSTAIQQILAENDRLRAFAVLILATFTTTALIVAQDSMDVNWSVIVGIVASIGALWVWWVVNADHPDYQDKIEPAAAVGGDDPRLPLSGDLAGFKH